MGILHAILVLVGIVVLSLSPMFLIIYITNQRKNKNIKALAALFKLQAFPDTTKFRRGLPYAKGYVENRWTYIQTTQSKGPTGTVSSTKYKTPLTRIGVEINTLPIQQLDIKRVKKIPTKLNPETLHFEDYFDVSIKSGNTVYDILHPALKTELLTYAQAYKQCHIYFMEDFLITDIRYELTSKKKYKQAIASIYLLQHVADALTS